MEEESICERIFKEKLCFFCGKFDTYDLGKDASIIVKNSEDLRMINYIINNKNKPNFNKPRYDVLLKKIYKKKCMNKINENYLKLVEDTILSNIHKYNYSPLTYTKKPN